MEMYWNPYFITLYYTSSQCDSPAYFVEGFHEYTMTSVFLPPGSVCILQAFYPERQPAQGFQEIGQILDGCLGKSA
jgi:hypothetical protein